MQLSPPQIVNSAHVLPSLRTVTISIDGKCFICMSVAGDPSPTFRRPGERDYPSSSESQMYFTAYDIRMPNLLYQWMAICQIKGKGNLKRQTPCTADPKVLTVTVAATACHLLPEPPPRT
jgi:hypothetical protein